MGNVPISMSLQEQLAGPALLASYDNVLSLATDKSVPTACITANAEWAGTLQSYDDLRPSDGALTHSLSNLNDPSGMDEGEVPSYE